ncbi:MAG TPA: hypothetical protein VF222_03500 [Nitrososphaeraceae archaeon]
MMIKTSLFIAEPDSDIQYLYSRFTKQYGFSISDMNIVEKGNKWFRDCIF